LRTKSSKSSSISPRQFRNLGRGLRRKILSVALNPKTSRYVPRAQGGSRINGRMQGVGRLSAIWNNALLPQCEFQACHLSAVAHGDVRKRACHGCLKSVGCPFHLMQFGPLFNSFLMHGKGVLIQAKELVSNQPLPAALMAADLEKATTRRDSRETELLKLCSHH
jgi:hypothetical protein